MRYADTCSRMAGRRRNRGRPTRVSHPCHTKLCQRGDTIDRGNRDRGTTELRGCQSQGDGLPRAPAQCITPTAQFQPISTIKMLNQSKEPT
jgi:hypothetical protein